MARLKGTPKTGGRKKGTPNKCTNSVKNVIALLVNKELATIDALLAQTSAETRLNFITRLLPYVLPKMQDVNITEEQPEDRSKYANMEVTDEMKQNAIALLMEKHKQVTQQMY